MGECRLCNNYAYFGYLERCAGNNEFPMEIFYNGACVFVAHFFNVFIVSFSWWFGLLNNRSCDMTLMKACLSYKGVFCLGEKNTSLKFWGHCLNSFMNFLIKTVSCRRICGLLSFPLAIWRSSSYSSKASYILCFTAFQIKHKKARFI